MATDKFLNLEGLTEVADKVNQKLRIVTEMPAAPSLNDVVVYNGATSAKYKQSSIYLYTTIETYYKWADSTNDYYTKAEAPNIGDIVYSDTLGTDSGYTIEAYDSENNQVTINSLVYTRDNTGDVPIYDWVFKGGTSVILNGQNKTGDGADFYAPTNAGTSGEVLVSNGTGQAPSWSSFSGYAPSFLDTSIVFAFGTKIPTVEGNSIIFDLDD